MDDEKLLQAISKIIEPINMRLENVENEIGSMREELADVKKDVSRSKVLLEHTYLVRFKLWQKLIQPFLNDFLKLARSTP